MKKIILDLCGGTGAWSKPYKDAGYDVRNITLPDYDVTEWNLKGDNIIFVNQHRLFNKYEGYNLIIPIKKIYGILAAPPCTEFSYARTNAKALRNLRGGMEIIISCLKIIWECQYRIKKDVQKNAPLKFWALENPAAMLIWFLGEPAFIFNPYDFGDMWGKKTCLWGKFNKLQKKPIEYNGVKFDRLEIKQLRKMGLKSSGDVVFADRTNRPALRAITPPGFAKAFFEANR